ncbi:MAG: S-layer family protein [Moorea sp. SIO2B7]|nr:S-layer family protein [Moorena sp. SIO2B7]
MRLKQTGISSVLSIISTLSMLSFSALNSRVFAQIIPDATLPNNSVVTSSLNIFTIEGGSIAGSNLFHSFGEFSLSTGNEAFFNNALTIENIISRVTGSSSSNINGLIRANGNANLFLINPNGIVFGANSSLNIGGSFLGSTADRLRFQDGSFYSATEANTPPLLTINVPIGLQFASNPGAIKVEGRGHNLSRISSFAPITRGSSSGLGVNSGNTLALVGGDITLNGGVLTASGGRIEIGSVGFQNAATPVQVNLNPNSSGWNLNYEDVQNFGDIQLIKESALDATGAGSGSIKVRGQNLKLNDGSVILIQNRGLQPLGNININTTNSIEISGTTSPQSLSSGLSNQTLTPGEAGDITIVTRILSIQDGGFIRAETFSNAIGGNINVTVSDLTTLTGFNPGDESSTGIFAATFGAGNAGNLNLSIAKLTALEGGFVSSFTFGSGDGGQVIVNASEKIEIIGLSPNASVSNLSATTFGAGNAGSLTVNTPKLLLQEGGRISSSTFGIGNAGSLTLNASDSVELSGTITSTNPPIPSFIQSAAIVANETFRLFLGLPEIPSGDSGNVTINTPKLRILDGGLINVRNDGTGNAGIILINGDSILLNRQGVITATTASGEGGNINLQVEDLVQLRNNSQITAEAGGIGNGGNIIINTDLLVALENSDIIANAFEGSGGNIQIKAQGIFGTEFRERLTPESDITASSQFGVSGNVTITNPTVDPNSVLVELPEQVSDSSDQVVVGCAAEGNSFTLTGKGGLPEDPTAIIRGQTVWRDLQYFSQINSSKKETVTGEQLSVINHQSPIQATGWIVNNQGKVELVSYLPNGTIVRPSSKFPECSYLPK